MASKINPFGAHICSLGFFGHSDKIAHRTLEFFREHVVGIVSEARIAQRGIWRVIADFFTMTAQRFHPFILNMRIGQGFLQILAIEVRQPPRHGKSADVYEQLNGMRLQGFDEIIKRSRGMADGVEGRHDYCSFNLVTTSYRYTGLSVSS